MPQPVRPASKTRPAQQSLRILTGCACRSQYATPAAGQMPHHPASPPPPLPANPYSSPHLRAVPGGALIGSSSRCIASSSSASMRRVTLHLSHARNPMKLLARRAQRCACMQHIMPRKAAGRARCTGQLIRHSKKRAGRPHRRGGGASSSSSSCSSASSSASSSP